MIKIVIITANDWQGLYLNGVLVTEDHKIDAIAALRAMDGYKFEGRLDFSNLAGVDEEWLLEQGRFPARLEYVIFK